MTNIFISYSRKDVVIAAKLASVLRQMGYSVWWDVSSLHSGQQFASVIERVIKQSHCVVVIWSETSISSQWVCAEAMLANKLGTLLPVIYQRVEPPLPFNTLHTEDLLNWQGNPQAPGFQRLLRSITRYCPLPSEIPVFQKPATPSPLSSKPWLLSGVTLTGAGLVLAGTVGVTLYPRSLDQHDFVVKPVPEVASEYVLPTAEPVTVTMPSTAVESVDKSTESQLHQLLINTMPVDVDAEITINGESWRSDSVYKPGRYTVVVSANGYHVFEKNITIENADFILPVLLDPIRYALTINTVPVNAKIKLLGIVPKYKAGMQLEPMEYQVIATALGYESKEIAVDLSKGDQTISIQLMKEHLPFEPKMVRIPAGSFMMGCLKGRDDILKGCDPDEKQPAVMTTVPEFWMAETEVTLEQFAVFVDQTGYVTTAEQSGGCWVDRTGEGSWGYLASSMWRQTGFQQNGEHPVSCVSWDDVQAFINWLNQKTGKHYKLPTETQWEYAARAGNDNAYAWGDESADSCGYANIADLAARTHYTAWKASACNDGYVYSSPVKTYEQNDFGLFDMHGNVLEWIEDEYVHELPQKLATMQDGGTANRVIRGGSWAYGPQVARAANRSAGSQRYSGDDIGFRLVEIRD